jgi:hypothetical protein
VGLAVSVVQPLTWYDRPEGVVAETSARLFCTAAKMIMSKYPDLFEGD